MSETGFFAGRRRQLKCALHKLMAYEDKLVVRVLEIGTYAGASAIALDRYWRQLDPNHHLFYVGVDLFEDLTPGQSIAEFSKKQLPPSLAEVTHSLNSAFVSHRLVKGDTRKVLPDLVASLANEVEAPDLIIVDGGHSIETIRSDMLALRPLLDIHPHTICLLDDYYDNREDVGCRQLVAQLRAGTLPGYEDFTAFLLDPKDTYHPSGLQVRMVSVERKPREKVEDQASHPGHAGDHDRFIPGDRSQAA